MLARGRGGAYKVVDENRELLELLQNRYPQVLQECPWVEGWLALVDEFALDLAKAGDLPKPDRPPRPWPGSPRWREATIDSADPKI